jgi:hypothetical protein
LLVVVIPLEAALEASTAQSSAPAIAAIRHVQQLRLDGIALMHIAETIAGHYGFDFESVFASLSSFPENLIEYAKTPEGVTALGIVVTNDLMQQPWEHPDLMVTIH